MTLNKYEFRIVLINAAVREKRRVTYGDIAEYVDEFFGSKPTVRVFVEQVDADFVHTMKAKTEVS